ncbi:MAG: class I SAM-dependent methyltransferase [Methylococcaceae bacterium]
MNIFDAANNGYKHKNLIFWIGMLRSLVSPINLNDRILDFGCGHGMFLQLLYDTHQFTHGVGVDLDQESIGRAKLMLSERHPNWPIDYYTSGEFNKPSFVEGFDHIFCQEILWMNPNLHDLASTLFSLLKVGGRCYCTMGSHANNPLWPYRREKMENEGVKTFTWTIDQVAKAFSDAGFAVGIRRLPVDGFIMYHPESTPENSHSLFELVQTTAECKMLFYFGKHEPVHKPERLQG